MGIEFPVTSSAMLPLPGGGVLRVITAGFCRDRRMKRSFAATFGLTGLRLARVER